MATQVTLNSGAVSSAGSLKLQTNGTTDAVTIDTAQNVGLGVTPSAWGGNYKVMQYYGGTVAGYNNTTMELYCNAYDSAAGAWKRVNAGYATRYSTSDGAHSWFTAGNSTSGSSISWTQAMTLDASGNLGVGTTNPLNRLQVDAASGFVARFSSTTDAAVGIRLYRNGTDVGEIGSADALFSGGSGSNFGITTPSTNALLFGTNATERARIDSSGNLLVGTTSSSLTNSSSIIWGPSAGGRVLQHASGTVSGAIFLVFAYNAGIIGSITQNGTTAVSYNTTSDYRLKENVTPLTGALAKVQALKPSEFDWIDGRHDDGFIAHELQTVLPNVVTGEKDAVNEDGTPKYQQVDYARIVPTLCAAIQEQQAIIQQLTERITALEAK